jgi:hypothetical protein
MSFTAAGGGGVFKFFVCCAVNCNVTNAIASNKNVFFIIIVFTEIPVLFYSIKKPHQKNDGAVCSWFWVNNLYESLNDCLSVVE